jgi:hypothetical protein
VKSHNIGLNKALKERHSHGRPVQQGEEGAARERESKRTNRMWQYIFASWFRLNQRDKKRNASKATQAYDDASIRQFELKA